MSEKTLFSPLDTRYSRDLPFSLSDNASLRSQVEVEKAWLLTLIEKGICPHSISAKELEASWANLSIEEVEEFEKTTKHATRALVEALSARLKAAQHPALADWVHVGLTSFDTVDTALRLRFREFFEEDYLPLLARFKETLVHWTQKHRKTPQVGRTHGQWAVPSFFAASFAEALYRIEDLEQKLHLDLADLRGQASGAIGGYHASSLLSSEPLELERAYLAKLRLKASYASIQTLPPEDLMALGHRSLLISSVVAKLANDLRHLARSEIAELAEGMAPGQVGSSTMPQKRNPWNLEHVCSLYKVLQSRVQLMELDLITEHQRDLTNSASGRFYQETFALAYLMLNRLHQVLQKLEVFPENMKKHLDQAGSSVFAEAFYVLLTHKGIPNAHSVVRESARESERKGIELLDELKSRGYFPPEFSYAELNRLILRGLEQKISTILKESN